MTAQLSPLSEALSEVMQSMARRRKHTWDRSLFVVMVDYGKFGVESITRPDVTRESLIADIAAGQFEHIIGIFEMNPFEGWSSDVTTDVLDAAEAIVRAAAV